MRKEAGIAPNTMTKMRRDEAVNLAILGRICDVLDCDFGDIMEHKCMNDDKGRCNALLKDKTMTYISLFSSAVLVAMDSTWKDLNVLQPMNFYRDAWMCNV